MTEKGKTNGVDAFSKRILLNYACIIGSDIRLLQAKT
jgi:hypothetical protein